MADSTITGLTANTTPLTTDIIPMVDDPGGIPLTQKITLANVNTLFQTLPLASAQITTLGAAAAIAGTDTLPVNQTATAKSATMTQLKTFMRPTIITGNSGTVDQTDIGAVTFQILTSANTDIPTTSVVTQLTASTMGAGWWFVEYYIIWQSNVTTTGITFIVDHTGTAVNSQYTREDMVASSTSLATVGIANQARTTSVTGGLPSTWSVRADAGTLGPNDGVDTTNVNQYTRITGLLLVTGSGNLLLQANSEVASTITRVSQGTYARYTRLS